MDDGATLMDTALWIDTWFYVLGMLLATGIVIALLVALAYCMYDWRRAKQHRWPK